MAPVPAWTVVDGALRRGVAVGIGVEDAVRGGLHDPRCDEGSAAADPVGLPRNWRPGPCRPATGRCRCWSRPLRRCGCRAGFGVGAPAPERRRRRAAPQSAPSRRRASESRTRTEPPALRRDYSRRAAGRKIGSAYQRMFEPLRRGSTERAESPPSRPQETMRSGWMRIRAAVSLDRPRPSANLDAAHPPGIGADDVVDHDRGAAAGPGVAELLRLRVVVPADLDRVELGVVGEPDRDHVRGAVRADGRDPAQPPLAGQVVELGVGEGARPLGAVRESVALDGAVVVEPDHRDHVADVVVGLDRPRAEARLAGKTGW